MDQSTKKETEISFQETKALTSNLKGVSCKTEINLDSGYEKKNCDQLMLTADKMMNKDLQLLHSLPVMNYTTKTVSNKSTKILVSNIFC